MKRVIIFVIFVFIMIFCFSLGNNKFPMNIDNNDFEVIYKNIKKDKGGIVLGFDDARINIIYQQENTTTSKLAEDFQEENLYLWKELIPNLRVPESIEFSELIPGIIGKEKIYSNSVRINTLKNTGFKELYFFNTVFNNANYTYYIYYEDDQPNEKFYDFINNKISFSSDIKPPVNKIVHNTITTSNSHLGYDQEGRKIVTRMVARNGMKISSGLAGRYINENYRLIQIKTTLINFTSNFIDQGTIHAEFKIGNKLYKTDSYTYFYLEPYGIVDYTTTIPYEKNISKKELQKALKNLKVILKYKKFGKEKEYLLVGQ